MNKSGQKLFTHSSDQEDIKKIQQMKKDRLPGWGYPQISKYIDIIKIRQRSTKAVTTQWSAQPISSIPGWLLLSSRNTAFKSTATFTCTDENPDSTWQNWEFRLQRLKRTWQITGNKTARSESQKDVRFLYQTDRQRLTFAPHMSGCWVQSWKHYWQRGCSQTTYFQISPCAEALSNPQSMKGLDLQENSHSSPCTHDDDIITRFSWTGITENLTSILLFASY